MNTVYHVVSRAVCAGAVALMAASAQAQNPFVGNFVNYPPNIDTITEFTPSGAQSTFASVLTCPTKLALDKAGNLFAVDGPANTVTKITPDGTLSTFASDGLSYPAPNPYACQFNRVKA